MNQFDYASDSNGLKTMLTRFLDSTITQIHQIRKGNYKFLHKKLTQLYQYHIQENDKNGFIRACQEHELLDILMQEPVTYRSFNKPRGYSGDAELIDYLYRLKGPGSQDSYLGRELFADILESSICQSVRWRAKYLADKIEEIYQVKGKPLHVLSIASGHLRELHYIQNFGQKVNRLYAIDQDPLSNEEARRSLPYKQLHFQQDSVLCLVRKKFKPETLLDFIYSAGLFDYLPDKLAERLITASFELLAPGGKLLIANFTPGLIEQAYMEAFMDWHLIYRDESQMNQLVCGIPEKSIKSQNLYRDPEGNVVYMEISKV